MMAYTRTFPQRVSDSIGGRISRLGEILNISGLIYNPLTFWNFQRVAKYSAPMVADGFQKVFPKFESIIDVGCGGGAYAAEFASRGIQTKAIEHSAYARKLTKRQSVDCYEFDLFTDQVSPLQDRFDIAYSFEVAEHIPQELSEKLIDYIVARSDTVVFSAAVPGQRGMGHINCQPQSFWQSIFEERGFQFCEPETDLLRKEFRDSEVAYWLINNTTVYKKTQ